MPHVSNRSVCFLVHSIRQYLPHLPTQPCSDVLLNLAAREIIRLMVKTRTCGDMTNEMFLCFEILKRLPSTLYDVDAAARLALLQEID